MSLIRDSIPDWVWPIVLVLVGISFFFKARAHRRNLVAAAEAPDAGQTEQDALRTQMFGGISMTAMLVGIAGTFVLPKPFDLVSMTAGLVVAVVFLLRVRLLKSQT